MVVAVEIYGVTHTHRVCLRVVAVSGKLMLKVH
jgi:hypothetical protein